MKLFLSKIKKTQKGFSLIELLIVVSIIAILASLAIPRFAAFQARARQAEAKGNLTHIYTLEMAYYGDNNTFATMAATGADTSSPTACTTPANDIGFSLTTACAKVRYQYDVNTVSATAFTGDAISGTAANNRVWPGCATADNWEIDETKDLAAVANQNAVEECNTGF